MDLRRRISSILAALAHNATQKAHSEFFGSLGQDMTRMGFRSRILGIFWPLSLFQLWPEWRSGGAFRAFWQPWPRKGRELFILAYSGLL